ncbi:MAG: hypothetical protein VXW81_09220, partial [Pseudomonadota bacterium]|nr:hypothetical protein [Pseudomonadota bacterium]
LMADLRHMHVIDPKTTTFFSRPTPICARPPPRRHTPCYQAIRHRPRAAGLGQSPLTHGK